MSKGDAEIQWIRLGDHIEVCNEVNTKGLGLEILGLNIEKEFMPTVANTASLDTSKYKVVRDNTFVFSGMQTGRDRAIRIGYYDRIKPSLISPAYTVFKLSSDLVLPEYLFMYFNRSEMDRFGWFVSDSSVRANLDWAVFESIQVPLPSKKKQEDVVAVWRELRDMAETNEKMANQLELLALSHLEELKHTCPRIRLGDHIKPVDERNKDNTYHIEDVRGISIEKKLIDTKANMTGVSLSNYKVLSPSQFAYVPTTSRNGGKITIAMNSSEQHSIISSSYITFTICSENLEAEYVGAFFNRSEFDRYARFHSWGSARETFSFDDMCEVMIPLPSREVQEKVAELYRLARECRKIAEKARRLSKEVCPALIQSVIHD